MSDDNSDNEQNWGSKKMQYYSMNKREDNDDSDFIEEEKEAIKLQNKRLEKIKKSKILSSEDDEEELKESPKKEKKLDLITDTKEEGRTFEKDNVLNDIKLCKKNLNDVSNDLNDVIEVISDKENKFFNGIPLTKEYLCSKKNLMLGYSLCLAFSAYLKANNKFSNHHPVIKKIETFKYLLENSEKEDDEVQDCIDKLLELYQNKLNGSKEEKDEIDVEEEEEEENNENENEELDEENEELDEENEGEEVEEDEENEEDYLEEENNDDKNKVSFLNKKTKRPPEENEEVEEEEEINDFEENEDKEEEEENNMNDEDDYVTSQINKYNNLKNQKKENIIKNKEKLKKDIARKNELAIQMANKEVLKARGIYRKRKQYQGNAKIMNRLKFAKKQKMRKKMVKEYEGKPDVYMGEATGIRRDLIRSTKIKS